MMTYFNRLKREAKESATWRGHDMKRFKTFKPNQVAESVCRGCNAYVQIDTKPLPNGISIRGDAIALNC